MNAPVQISSVIGTLNELPAWNRVINEVAVRNEARNQLIALEVSASPKVAYIVRANGFGTGLALHALKSDITDAGYSLSAECGNIVTATSAVIAALYEGVSGEEKTEAEAKHDSLVRFALERAASDIHIIVAKDIAKVFMRIDGSLKLTHRMPSAEARSMIGVLYENHSSSKNEQSFRTNTDLECQVTRNIDGREINLRFQLKPTDIASQSFAVFLRLASGEALKQVTNLEQAGYTPGAARRLEQMASIPRGLVFLIGMTGSGKTTTLLQLLGYKQLMEQPNHLNIMSVEDPVEYQIEGVVQTPVVLGGDQGDLSPFANAVKRAVRCDPDALMVGEIRDNDTAEAVQRVAQTDHPVYATLHASSPFEALLRLRELDMSMDVLGSPSFLAGLVYQRLVPKVCPSCGVYAANHPELLGAELVERLKLVLSQAEFNQVKVPGENHHDCKACAGTGRKGRALVAEAVIPDKNVKHHISEGDIEGAMNYWYRGQNNMSQFTDFSVEKCMPSTDTCVGHGLYLVGQGILSPIEFEKSLGRIELETIEWVERGEHRG